MGSKITAKDFRKGNATFSLKEEERIYLLSLFKKAKPKDELQRRIVKRAILKLMGAGTYGVPLYPDKECPICEYEIRGDRFETHMFDCRRKKAMRKGVPNIDPAILEMVNAGL